MALGLLLVPLLVAMNAFFVAAEYAVVAIKGHQVEALRRAGRTRTAAAVEKLKADAASAIGAIQVCITLTNLLLGGFGEPPLTGLLLQTFSPLRHVVPLEVFQAVSVALAFTLVTFITVVFSELLPKAMTLRFVPTVASLTARPVLVILRITRPLVWLMNLAANLVTVPLGLGRVEESEREFHTPDEIRLIASQSEKAGAPTTRERSLILNSLALGRREARRIMVPRSRIAYLDLTKSLDENKRVLNEHLFSRMPLCNGGIDNVVGVIRVREAITAFYAEGEVSVLQLLANPPVFAPDTIPLDKLLLLIDEKHSQMVMLVDEFGGVEGLVTLRDVIDELVGKPMEVTPAEAGGVQRLTVSGDKPLHELCAAIGREIGADSGAVTVGGLITAELGRFPRRGDVTLVDGVTLKVLEGDRRMVKTVEVTLPPVEPD